jgi:hypothetical protein
LTVLNLVLKILNIYSCFLSGILLFVDISGFTALSQKMSIESFQSHINIYFTKIIDIIHSFNGQVVKFAGDAFFVIWQVEPVKDDSTSKLMSDSCIKALACAERINKECNNFAVKFTPLSSSTLIASPTLLKDIENFKFASAPGNTSPFSIFLLFLYSLLLDM